MPTKLALKLAIPPFIFFTLIVILIQGMGKVNISEKEMDAIRYFLDTAYGEDLEDCVNVGFYTPYEEQRNQVLMQRLSSIIVKDDELNAKIGVRALRKNVVEIAQTIRDFMQERGNTLVCNYGPYSSEDLEPNYLSSVSFNRASIKLNYIFRDSPQVDVVFDIKDGKLSLTKMIIGSLSAQHYIINVIDGDQDLKEFAVNNYVVSMSRFKYIDFKQIMEIRASESANVMREQLAGFNSFNDLLEGINREESTNVALENIYDILDK